MTRIFEQYGKQQNFHSRAKQAVM